MATLKRLEKRMNDVESWVKDFNKGSGPAQTMDNLNWLVGQTKNLGERLSMTEQQALQMQNALEQNAKIVEQFVFYIFFSEFRKNDFKKQHIRTK